jgi:uncharacterized protein (TIGR00288 family)
MGTPYTRAPHQGGTGSAGVDSLHAALLIDFDNVTMGMRSDLSKELKTLLDSDVIKGKVTVQRAYADWRRYPQYIVPLSEASVDLIFAPAYGSNKKNATDIRMAIDAVELVFIRPEIGTYILLTGDSDFSSLVLKLKEYGKYVIGVGIQESSSDILVQNCDEYYSYTSLTGLTKTTELTQTARDPWVLVNEALKEMVSRGDVMRSDRLKQVMQELDANFDEGAIGYSKFSRFLAEASSRGLVTLKKQENGQYEVSPTRGRGRRPSSDSGGSRGRHDHGRPRRDRKEKGAKQAEATSSSLGSEDPLQDAYALLISALEDFRSSGRDQVRDSDVKRKILQKDRSFDEAELGFAKFSRFLAQAAEHGVIDTERTDRGNFHVSLPAGGGDSSPPDPDEEPISDVVAPEEAPVEASSQDTEEQPAFETLPVPDAEPEPSIIDVLPTDTGDAGLRLGPRGGSTRRRGGDGPPPFFEGQTAGAPTVQASEAPPSTGSFDTTGLGLPTAPDAIVRYLTHRYKGVGEKTAETLVDRFGTDLFRAMQEDPEAISTAIPSSRAEQVLEAWRADYARRSGGSGGGGSNRGRS